MGARTRQDHLAAWHLRLKFSRINLKRSWPCGPAAAAHSKSIVLPTSRIGIGIWIGTNGNGRIRWASQVLLALIRHKRSFKTKDLRAEQLPGHFLKRVYALRLLIPRLFLITAKRSNFEREQFEDNKRERKEAAGKGCAKGWTLVCQTLFKSFSRRAEVISRLPGKLRFNYLTRF